MLKCLVGVLKVEVSKVGEVGKLVLTLGPLF